MRKKCLHNQTSKRSGRLYFTFNQLGSFLRNHYHWGMAIARYDGRHHRSIYHLELRFGVIAEIYFAPVQFAIPAWRSHEKFRVFPTASGSSA